MTEKVKLNKHYMWDILEIDWNEVKVTFNGKVSNFLNQYHSDYGINSKFGR